MVRILPPQPRKKALESLEFSGFEAFSVFELRSKGHAFEYIYQDEDTKTKVSELTPKDIFVVYDDTMKRRALFAVRYGRHSADSDEPGKLFGEVLTRSYIQPFEGSKFLEAKENPYGYIPCIEWKLNNERMGLFESVAGLVEMYNHTLSEKRLTMWTRTLTLI